MLKSLISNELKEYLKPELISELTNFSGKIKTRVLNMQQKRKEAKEQAEIENLKEVTHPKSWKPKVPSVSMKLKDPPNIEEKKEIIEEALMTENNENQNPLISTKDDDQTNTKSDSKLKSFVTKMKKVWK
jgi:hypothetical protein